MQYGTHPLYRTRKSSLGQRVWFLLLFIGDLSRYTGLVWNTPSFLNNKSSVKAPSPPGYGQKVNQSPTQTKYYNTLPHWNALGAVTGVNNNQDLIWCAKRGVYMGFWVHRGF